MGTGVMEQLLSEDAPGPASEAGRTVLDLAMSPSRLPELASSLRAAAFVVGETGYQFIEKTTRRLRRYRDGRVRVSLQGRDLVVALDMRLR